MICPPHVLVLEVDAAVHPQAPEAGPHLRGYVDSILAAGLAK